MTVSKLQRISSNASKAYTSLRALKEHFNLSWGEVNRITKEWKLQNPRENNGSPHLSKIVLNDDANWDRSE